MRQRAQVFSRKVKQHKHFKMCLEGLGLFVRGISAADKDEMVNMIKDEEPDIVIIPSDYWDEATAYQVGVLHKRLPDVKIVVINMVDYPVKEACDFILNGATSYVDYLCGQEEFSFGLNEVCKGKTFISSDVKAGLLNKSKDIFYEMTAAELAVLKQQYKWCENEDIADLLHISVNTVIKHKQNIIRKLKVKKIGKAVYIAIQLGLINPYKNK